MSDEPRTQPSSELSQLLRAFSDQPLPTLGPEREASREARMVEHIDDSLRALVRERRAARRRVFAVAAAAILLLGVGSLSLRRPSPAVVIQRERLQSPSVEVTEREAPRAAATTEPEVKAMPSKRRLEPARAPSKVEGTVVEPPAPQVIAQEQEGNSSTLARENALFREAAEAARSGDVERASALFEDLSQKHPTSPLAQTALVRRFRLLAKAGRREEARSDARRYLDTFPNGFAVAEARALLGEPTDAGRPKLEAEH